MFRFDCRHLQLSKSSHEDLSIFPVRNLSLTFSFRHILYFSYISIKLQVCLLLDILRSILTKMQNTIQAS